MTQLAPLPEGFSMQDKETTTRLVQISGNALKVQCGSDLFCLEARANDFAISVLRDNNLSMSCNFRALMTDLSRCQQVISIERFELENQSEEQCTILSEGKYGKQNELRWILRIQYFFASNRIKLELTTRNPRRAQHLNGYWDLGDPGSIYVRDLSLELKVTTTIPIPTSIQWQVESEGPVQKTIGKTWEIYQESSGGEQWQSRNHVNCQGKIPLRMKGYRVRQDEQTTTGDRANPVVCLSWEGGYLAAAIEEFWQKFPTAMEVQENCLLVRLWPAQFDDPHELQAGEQCTRVVWFEWGTDASHACQRLSSIYHQPPAKVDRNAILAARSIGHLAPGDIQDRPEFQTLLNESIAGPNSFFSKREAIDEYGWRNFGDMWADHEGAYSEYPSPVISHYNNQYDLLHSLLVQYIRSGDARWWQLADPLARHVIDIDIYHTERDKSLYNGGLFWHTAHYHDVGTATHRCMATKMRGKKIPAPGTGPSNEHNYSTGLLLYYHLTQSPQAKQAVVKLADWVITMDAGELSLRGVASSQPTGFASSTSESNYHGPGRGAGNSLQSLLNGWLVTNAEKYLNKAIELIHRCIHPCDNLAERQLNNAELRWSYTVFLQALVRFLELTVHRTDLLETQDYAQASLLHYASWMEKNERFYLDEPEKLEFPTETWAAQELRKGTTLLLASQYATSEERIRFEQRGKELLDRAWKTLMTFPSRNCTRSLAVVLQQGYLETALLAELRSTSPLDNPLKECKLRDFGNPTQFITQKQDVNASIRSPQGWLSILACVTKPTRWVNVFQQTWLAERLRCWFAS